MKFEWREPKPDYSFPIMCAAAVVLSIFGIAGLILLNHFHFYGS